MRDFSKGARKKKERRKKRRKSTSRSRNLIFSTSCFLFFAVSSLCIVYAQQLYYSISSLSGLSLFFTIYSCSSASISLHFLFGANHLLTLIFIIHCFSFLLSLFLSLLLSFSSFLSSYLILSCHLHYLLPLFL